MHTPENNLMPTLKDVFVNLNVVHGKYHTWLWQNGNLGVVWWYIHHTVMQLIDDAHISYYPLLGLIPFLVLMPLLPPNLMFINPCRVILDISITGSPKCHYSVVRLTMPLLLRMTWCANTWAEFGHLWRYISIDTVSLGLHVVWLLTTNFYFREVSMWGIGENPGHVLLL